MVVVVVEAQVDIAGARRTEDLADPRGVDWAGTGQAGQEDQEDQGGSRWGNTD